MPSPTKSPWSPNAGSPTTTPPEAEERGWVPSDPSLKIRRPRASKPKTRTGCKTCKIRRVKCDETKPSCLRCLKFHGTCDGFGYSSASGQPGAKPLLPKPAKERPLTIKIEGRPRSQLTVNDFQPSLFTNEQEHSSFRYFHDKTANRLAGYFDESSMWNRLILQACESDHSIRHAVIAIGALDMALDTAQVRKKAEWLEPAKVQLQAESQRQFALQSYGKAIKRMRDSLSEPRQDMRTILIACLLFVAFEAFHGNNNSAVQQAHGGIKLLNGWLPQWLPKGKDEFIPKGLRSPAPHVIEDELVQAFARLDTFTTGTMDEEPSRIHPLLKTNIGDILHLMPETFWDIEEARMYFDLVWRNVLHFILWVHGCGASVCFDYANNPFERADIFPGPHKKLFVEKLKKNPAMTLEAQQHCEVFEKWTAAFDPLFHQSRTAAGRNDFAAATVLRIHAKASYIAISGGFRDPLDFDKRDDEYLEILDLAEILTDTLKLREPGPRHTLVLDGPLSGCLYIVVTTCRNPSIRRRAIDILERQPREGLWDSALTAEICRTVVEIEERGMVGDFVEEEARISNIWSTFSLQDRKGTMQYTWFMPRPGEEVLKVMETDFTW